MKVRSWRLPIIGCFVLISSCAVGMATPPVSTEGGDPRLVVTTRAVDRTTNSTLQGPGTTTTTWPARPGALITPTGVVVAILSQSGKSFIVQTPCGNQALVTRGSPLGPVDVVLDPGHGGAADSGAVGFNGLKEAEINLRVAREVRSVLASRGIASVLTRTADYTSLLGTRAALADHAGAALMVSIHHNAPTANIGTTPGTEVFVQNGSSDSRRLGMLVHQSVVDALSSFEDVLWTAAPDAGVLEVLNTRGADAYGMLRNPETVTALAELAYISHRPEAALIETREYLDKVSVAVADAIEAYLTTDEEGSGYVDVPRVFNPQRGISSDVCEDPDLG